MPTTINPSGQTITQYNIQTGAAGNNLNNVAPSGTSGVPVISQGAAAQPVFGTAVVAGGGTGQVTLTNHGVLIGAGTTAITQLAAGTAGQVLQSGGASADPAYSTATYPATAGASGTIHISNGTNIVNTTATYPSTTTSQQILYSSTANTIGGLATGNSLLAATNASGTLAMRAFSVVTQVFTSTGTYTPTTGMLYCVAECVGGGGGGGGTAATGAATCAAAAGGGGGGYARKTISSSTIGSGQTVTVGAAGSAATAGNNAGGGGGTSSLGAIITATGGSGGAGSPAGTFDTVVGTAGGAGSSGDFNTNGGPGIGSFFVLSSGVFSCYLSGAGGSSFFGGGANAPLNAAGIAATSYGGGGSGASSANTSNAAFAGGAGFKGIVVVTEYCIN